MSPRTPWRVADDALTKAERANDAARQVHKAALAELRAKLEETTQTLSEERQEVERLGAETNGDRHDAAGRLELNSATVEGLRGLGLSITQAARLVTRRDAVGGFGSAEDLEAVPGSAAATSRDVARRRRHHPALGPGSR